MEDDAERDRILDAAHAEGSGKLKGRALRTANIHG